MYHFAIFAIMNDVIGY